MELKQTMSFQIFLRAEKPKIKLKNLLAMFLNMLRVYDFKFALYQTTTNY